MSALMTARLSDDGGNTYEVEVKTRDVLRWEKRFPGRVLGKLNEKLTYVYELVYVASRRPESFEVFCDTFDIEVDDEDAETVSGELTDSDPTWPAA